MKKLSAANVLRANSAPCPAADRIFAQPLTHPPVHSRTPSPASHTLPLVTRRRTTAEFLARNLLQRPVGIGPPMLAGNPTETNNLGPQRRHARPFETRTWACPGDDNSLFSRRML
ncbi:predicted protein [Coccidioides posadasii str. Silveira]|uniref:Predicted protein n=1 Tax=Coccidioides posadasii (strain RMSCC 757 / Silveira) TaxID=443226 RepID=E9DAF8_COCPS|nr:predicted protein [Coccidioides posadasii str. Silveira]